MSTLQTVAIKHASSTANNIVLSTNGSVTFAGGLVANGSLGTSGQMLTSNGTGSYWSTPVNTGKAIAMAIVFG